MEVELWNYKCEREMCENFAELYKIVIAMATLKKAHVRRAIPPVEYGTECFKLMAHFKTLSLALNDIVPSVDHFHDMHEMDCPAALNCLMGSVVLATVEHRVAAAMSATTSAAIVTECVDFITSIGSLKLNMTAADQVHLLLAALLVSLNKLPADFEGKARVRERLPWLSKMGAADELIVLLDLDSSNNSSMAALPASGT